MFHLLKCVAGAVVKNGGKFLLNLIPGGEALADIAADAWENWPQKHDEAALRAEVQALAQAPAEQVRAAAQAAVQAEAAGQPPQVQEALTAYLAQVPAMIRRSLRRPSDPTGTSVPATQHFRGGEDLLPFLPPRPPRFKAGDMVPGLDWELVELLGVGGFGEVWKARHRYLTSEPLVALKFCLDESEAASKALKNEAGVLDRVRRHGRHDGIVTLRQTYFSARPPCLEYEYVEGGDLTGLIQELNQKGQLTPQVATRLLLTLTQAVAFAHRADPPIVHSDLKPANVLVQRDAQGEIVLRITDFGIGGLAAGHAIQRTRLGATSRSEMVTDAVRGAYTPFYAPPEQIARRRDQQPDPRDDVHALGMIWYQLVTGDFGLTALPSDWRDEVQERGLSTELTQLLAACIASKAEKRPASAVELAERLGNLLGEGPAPPPPKKERQPGELLTNSIGMKLAWIPPGRFLMGSPPGEAAYTRDETQHRVTLTKGFYLGIYPVTQAQWQAVMGDNLSHFKGEDRPVEMVSWDDCQEFCKQLAAREGKPYRLPTEAEWEYACRASTTTAYSFGEAAKKGGFLGFGATDVLGEYAWYNKNSVNETHPVGQKKPNFWGLYDMHGNVWEWCQDWYGEYSQNNSTDPEGAKSGEARVVRGGGWLCGAWFSNAFVCRAASRTGLPPGYRDGSCGVRVCVCLD